MRFTKPSKIQEKALPLLLRNPPTNLIGQSQSGTGKTAAFVLNMFSRVKTSGDLANKPQAIVLAPSRELARQILGVCQIMGKAVQGMFIFESICDCCVPNCDPDLLLSLEYFGYAMSSFQSMACYLLSILKMQYTLLTHYRCCLIYSCWCGSWKRTTLSHA